MTEFNEGVLNIEKIGECNPCLLRHSRLHFFVENLQVIKLNLKIGKTFVYFGCDNYKSFSFRTTNNLEENY